MNSSDLEKRVTRLELARLLRNVGPSKFRNRSSRQWLDELADVAWQVKELALAAGDYRAALASIDSLCTLVQLRARLGGELRDTKPTDVLEPNLDAERAADIAKMYLSRHQRAKAGGDQ